MIGWFCWLYTARRVAYATGDTWDFCPQRDGEELSESSDDSTEEHLQQALLEQETTKLQAKRAAKHLNSRQTQLVKVPCDRRLEPAEPVPEPASTLASQSNHTTKPDKSASAKPSQTRLTKWQERCNELHKKRTSGQARVRAHENNREWQHREDSMFSRLHSMAKDCDSKLRVLDKMEHQLFIRTKRCNLTTLKLFATDRKLQKKVIQNIVILLLVCIRRFDIFAHHQQLDRMLPAGTKRHR